MEKPFGRDLKSVAGPRGRGVMTEAFGIIKYFSQNCKRVVPEVTFRDGL